MQLAGLFLIWDFQVRSEALSALAQVPQSDVITSEHWVAIRKGLLAALADEDDHLSVSAVNNRFQGLLTHLLRVPLLVHLECHPND